MRHTLLMTFCVPWHLCRLRDAPGEERLLLETDSPYLAPGPWIVPSIAAKVAELKGRKVADVLRMTTENASRLYSLPERIDRQASW